MGNREFFSVPVKQRDFTLYLVSLKASDLPLLCEGLRSPESREPPLISVSDAEQATKDTSEFVKAVSSSRFSREVSEIESTSYEDDNPYQRIIDETRVRSIAAYLKEEFALMPNGVILAVDEQSSYTVETVETVEEAENGQLLKLTIEWGEKLPMNIIDGQHRVEGLKLLLKDNPSAYEEFELPVCILVDLPFYMQAEIFAIINGKQTKVPRSRVYDLLGYMPIQDASLKEKAYQGELAIHRFCHLVIRVLNTSQKSPWYQKIKMRGAGPGVVTQAAMVDHLAKLVTPRKDSRRLSTLPVFYSYFKEDDLVGLSRICVIYFMAIARAWPRIWRDEDDDALRSSLFGKTNGIAVMFMILHDLIIIEGGPENLKFEMILELWGKAPESRITQPPTGGSRGYQIEWYKAIITEMLGPQYHEKITTEFEGMRERLRTSGALF